MFQFTFNCSYFSAFEYTTKNIYLYLFIYLLLSFQNTFEARERDREGEWKMLHYIIRFALI